jgi:hypothetical protein
MVAISSATGLSSAVPSWNTSWLGNDVLSRASAFTPYTDWAEVGGAAAQLGLNLIAFVLGGLARLTVQRRLYEVRLKRHSSGSTPEP